MQVIVELPEQKFELIQMMAMGGLGDFVHKAVAQGVILPKNPTNGDMIKAMYPDLIFCESMVEGYVNHVEGIIGRDKKDMYFDIDWWDAPYGREKSGACK